MRYALLLIFSILLISLAANAAPNTGTTSASNLSYAGGATISAGTVEAAIDEVSSEKADVSSILTASQVVRTDASSVVSDTVLSDWSAVNASSNTEGVKFPQSTAPAQTAEGLVAWDTDDDILYMGNGTAKFPTNDWSRDAVRIVEEFMGIIPTNGNPNGFNAYTANSGAVVTFSGTGGILTGGALLAASTTNNAIAYVGKYTTSTGDRYLSLAGAEASYEVRAQMYNSLCDVTDDCVVRFGWLDTRDNSAEPTDGVYWEYNRAVNTDWQFVTAKSGTRTKVDTDVAVSTSWAVFKVVCNAAGTSCTASINGTNIPSQPQTTNLPNTYNDLFVQGAFIVKTAGTSARYFGLDYWVEKYVGITR